MNDFWFTSDWHLGHARINELARRPFSSVDEMNETIIARYNELVKPEDSVWIVGDVCMGPIDRSLALVQRFNGRKYLICGNHDRPFHGYADNATNPDQRELWRSRYRAAGFDLVDTGFTMLRRGFGHLVGLRLPENDQRRTVVELSHFPSADVVDGESQPNRLDRFADYRPRKLDGTDRNRVPRWVVCGHVHDSWTVQRRNVNVGVDRWNYYPVHEDQLLTLIDEKEAEYANT